MFYKNARFVILILTSLISYSESDNEMKIRQL